jgi:hypothetical protein
MPRTRRSEPTTLGALLSRSALSRPRDNVGRELWALSVGERVAARTEPVEIRQGVLWVRVSSSVWAQELSLLAPSIIERLREHHVVLSALRFTTGPVTPWKPMGRPLRPRKQRTLPEDLLERLARIDDPELREAIAAAAGLALDEGLEG